PAGLPDALAGRDEGGEVQHSVEVRRDDIVGEIVYPAPNQPGAGGNRVLVAGREVVDDHHLVACLEQQGRDGAADVSGTPGHQKFHSAPTLTGTSPSNATPA